MKKLIIIMLVLISCTSFAQQDPVFTHYMFNKLAVNPGYTGSRDVLATDLLYRKQWVNINGSPQTFSFTGHSPVKNKHLGLGIYAYRDAIGPSIDQGAMASFAYKVLFPKSKLAFGINAGFKNYYIDRSKLNPKDVNDLSIQNQMENKFVFDVDFGVYYYAKNYFSGISTKHLLQNKMDINTLKDGTSSFTKSVRHYYFMSGFVYPVSREVTFRPSFLVKYVQHAPLQADVNLSLLLNNLIWFGLSYRTDKALSLLLDFNLTKQLHLGYSYDIWFNQLLGYNKGSHEIRIGYDFNLYKIRNRMLSPRYF